MKTKNMNALIEKIGMSEIFKVEEVDGVKRLNRWGFFAKQEKDEYAIYRPAHAIVALDNMLEMYDDDLSGIDMVTEDNLHEEIALMKNIQPIALMEVCNNTACGWYYDTIVPMV